MRSNDLSGKYLAYRDPVTWRTVYLFKLFASNNPDIYKVFAFGSWHLEKHPSKYEDAYYTKTAKIMYKIFYILDKPNDR